MKDLKKLISWLTPLPYDVVLTHGHPDHIGGAAQFEEVYIHEKDEDSLKPISSTLWIYVKEVLTVQREFHREH